MENAVSIHNWNNNDREVLFEQLKGDVDRQRVNIKINRSLLKRFRKLHPHQANGKHQGTTLSEAANKGLLLYVKLYEHE